MRCLPEPGSSGVITCGRSSGIRTSARPLAASGCSTCNCPLLLLLLLSSACCEWRPRDRVGAAISQRAPFASPVHCSSAPPSDFNFDWDDAVLERRICARNSLTLIRARVVGLRVVAVSSATESRALDSAAVRDSLSVSDAAAAREADDVAEADGSLRRLRNGAGARAARDRTLLLSGLAAAAAGDRTRAAVLLCKSSRNS